MKTFKLFFVLLFIFTIIIFSFQNIDSMTIMFLFWKIDIPIFASVILIYILGAISGGLLFSLIKKISSSNNKT